MLFGHSNINCSAAAKSVLVPGWPRRHCRTCCPSPGKVVPYASNALFMRTSSADLSSSSVEAFLPFLLVRGDEAAKEAK